MNIKDFGRIGVLAGGPSNERQISLKSGEAVFNALKDLGCDAVLIDIKKEPDIEEIRSHSMDIAFIALHGRFGEDGTIQQILEDLRIPYTGSGPVASRLAMDKIASKEIFVKSGLEVPRYKVLERKFDYRDLKRIIESIEFPVVVKPQLEGSSIGVSISTNTEELKDAIEAAFRYGDRIIVEEYIKGRELTVGILDEAPLPVVEIVVGEQFYNFTAKYKSDSTKHLVPADINIEIYKKAQNAGCVAHTSLGCRGFSRVDMIWDQVHGKIRVLEVNSIPGLTDHSLLPKAAACAGVGFKQLCLKIIELAKGVKEIGQAVKKV